MQRIASSSTSPFSSGLPALYAVAFLSGISLGLFNPFISTLMAQQGISDLWIGANSTLYFLTIAIGTPIVAKLLQHFGLRKTMIAGFTLMAATAPLFPWTDDLLLWFILRAVMGGAVCLYLVSGQTAINYFCTDSNRAIVNGIDALSFSLGFGLGPLIGAIAYDYSPKITFSLGSLLILSGVLFILFGLPEKKIRFQPLRLGVYKRIKLPLQGAFSYGVAIATLVSLYPVYLLRQGYPISQIGYTFSAFILGGLLATLPVTYLADRLGKLHLLKVSISVIIFSILGLSFVDTIPVVYLIAFATGAAMSPIFPLALAIIGGQIANRDLPSGSSLFTAAYSVGCTAGPILSAISMHYLGNRYLFAPILFTFLILAFCLLFFEKR
ncbi:MFS transporter [Romeria aff. gracilis LEGE 07310]|uniref:MFS transporter n=1 Tax=Vasconcelosia minhoensis LEGE 07310 TaxID=915328 RepID=A0A8J7AMR9_9CYAN|nr:MFS transporter [Romeria gracilis]MBE9077334.1 MFS transporter [Romeria aff. gracilis LEGE 07310]